MYVLKTSWAISRVNSLSETNVAEMCMWIIRADVKIDVGPEDGEGRDLRNVGL
jgi:hypothetical protein